MKNDSHHLTQLSKDFETIEKALFFIQDHAESQPSLEDIAQSVNMSPFHFQRLFSRWIGISPKRFLQFLTKEHAKSLLDKSRNILDTAFESGLSGPGRLHDLFIHCEAVTPGEYKSKGTDLSITYGITASPFGECLIATTKRGICTFKFKRDLTDDQLASWLKTQWPKAGLVRKDPSADRLAQIIFPPPGATQIKPLHLYIRGTNFQIKVWEALIKIPSGALVSYQDIASYIRSPKAVRAVGTAVGSNPIPYLIPCHRVIRKSGVLGNYGEGKARKKAIIGWELAQGRS